jgi:hypothetical protein
VAAPLTKGPVPYAAGVVLVKIEKDCFGRMPLLGRTELQALSFDEMLPDGETHEFHQRSQT